MQARVSSATRPRLSDNGTVNVLNAMFVQYFLPARPRHELPIVMIHGGGGQGTDWLETPDGRDGWVDYFVADGWDVYVVDRPGHGRSQSNAGCGNGQVGAANSGIISRLSTSAPTVWPGGAPTPTNETVIGWTASSATAPYCGDPVAARTISALLDEIGPAILLAHSAGGGSTFRVPELNPDKVAGILAFEAAGANPVESGRGSNSPTIVGWTDRAAACERFPRREPRGLQHAGRQSEPARQLRGFANRAARYREGDLASEAQLECQTAVWNQAGADASYVWFSGSRLARRWAFRDGAARQRRLCRRSSSRLRPDRLGGEELGPRAGSATNTCSGAVPVAPRAPRSLKVRLPQIVSFAWPFCGVATSANVEAAGAALVTRYQPCSESTPAPKEVAISQAPLL